MAAACKFCGSFLGLRSKLSKEAYAYVCDMVRSQISDHKTNLNEIIPDYDGLLAGAKRLPNLGKNRAYWLTVSLPKKYSEKYSRVTVYMTTTYEYNRLYTEVNKYKLDARRT